MIAPLHSEAGIEFLLAQPDPREREAFFENAFERRKDEKEFSAYEDLKKIFTGILRTTFSIPSAYDGSAEHRAALRTFTGILIGRHINAATLVDRGGRVQLEIDADLRAEVLMLKELTWTYVIEAPSMAARQHGQKRVIEGLFSIYTDVALTGKPSSWQLFPTYYREKLEDVKGK